MGQVKAGNTIELDIIDLGSNGEGIGHYQGYTVFLPFALPNERVLAKVEHVKKSLLFATLQTVITPSPQRVVPVCPLFTKCGGCDLMHVQYEQQLDYKQKNLKNILRKNANFVGKVQDFIPSAPLYYRNKIQLPFGKQNGRIVLGFYQSGTHKVIPLTKCYLHADWAENLIKVVLAFANSTEQSVYSEKSGKGLLRHLTARYIDGKLSVTLVINGNTVKGINLLGDELEKLFPSVTLYLSINKKRNNVIMGDKLIKVMGKEQVANISGISLELNPMSFFQVNDKIRDKIYYHILKAVAPDSNTVFIDCYAGVGLLGALIAKKAAQVYNIEIISEGVEDANKLYAANNLMATNINGDAAKELPKLLADSSILDSNKRIFIFVDPPRKGLSKELITTLNSLPKKQSSITLVYLSCNPSTLSRDLSLLTTYHPTSITPYDMFPQTKHVETVVLLSRVEE